MFIFCCFLGTMLLLAVSLCQAVASKIAGHRAGHVVGAFLILLIVSSLLYLVHTEQRSARIHNLDELYDRAVEANSLP